MRFLPAFFAGDGAQARTLAVHPTSPTVSTDARDLVIRWRWGDPVGVARSLFLIACIASLTLLACVKAVDGLGPMLLELGRALSWLVAGGLRRLWAMPSLRLPLAAASGGGAYGLLASALNSTAVRATETELTVSHGPLPWPGGRRVAVEDIAGLAVHSRMVERAAPDELGSDRYLWDIFVIRDGGGQQPFLRGLASRKHAELIERELAGRLRLRARLEGGAALPAARPPWGPRGDLLLFAWGVVSAWSGQLASAWAGFRLDLPGPVWLAGQLAGIAASLWAGRVALALLIPRLMRARLGCPHCGRTTLREPRVDGLIPPVFAVVCRTCGRFSRWQPDFGSLYPVE